ncbi:MAG: hypothetical protein DSY85_13390 [Marinomonas sp.]|nr:MAG: hypothetical protein DSY85_13390 [Marinomonas sp.]
MTDSPNIWVTPKVRTVAKMLINDLHIRDGEGLAAILCVAPNFSNHEAVTLWVQAKYSINYEKYSTDYFALRNALIANVPHYLQGDTW